MAMAEDRAAMACLATEADEDLFVSARDLWKFLREPHTVSKGVAADSFGMFPPDMICLREILRGHPHGCVSQPVRMVRLRPGILGTKVRTVEEERRDLRDYLVFPGLWLAILAALAFSAYASFHAGGLVWDVIGALLSVVLILATIVGVVIFSLSKE